MDPAGISTSGAQDSLKSATHFSADTGREMYDEVGTVSRLCPSLSLCLEIARFAPRDGLNPRPPPCEGGDLPLI